LTFMTVVPGDLALVFINRSWSRTVLATLRTSNPALWWLTVMHMIADSGTSVRLISPRARG